MTRAKFERFTRKTTHWLGTPQAMLCAVSIVVAWLVSGVFLGFSDTHQLLINTFTTIATFLMVFVLQNSQNKDSLAIHLKLNEIIRATENSRNQLVGLEEAEHEETKQLQAEFKQIRDEDCNSSKEGEA